MYCNREEVAVSSWLVGGTETKLLIQLFFQRPPGCLDSLVLLWVVEIETSLSMYCLGACGSDILLSRGM